jgi:two-component system, NarL family, invasion response regulator UvrY
MIMIQILIVDDHAVVRMGLARIIEFNQDLSVTAQAGSAEEAINILMTKKFDVVILDISLPGRSGIDIIKDILSMQPRMKIIILSMYKEKQFAIRAFKAGAVGYLTKEMAPDEIVKAILKVWTGGKYVSAELATILLDEMIEPSENMPHETLSNRELEVMRLIAAGKSLTLIAADLSLSDRTVSTYRTRILEKMGLKNNAEIIHYAIKHDLV